MQEFEVAPLNFMIFTILHSASHSLHWDASTRHYAPILTWLQQSSSPDMLDWCLMSRCQLFATVSCRYVCIHKNMKRKITTSCILILFSVLHNVVSLTLCLNKVSLLFGHNPKLVLYSRENYLSTQILMSGLYNIIYAWRNSGPRSRSEEETSMLLIHSDIMYCGLLSLPWWLLCCKAKGCPFNIR